MASITQRGDAYKITVLLGKDIDGKQLRKCTTYHPDPKLRGKALEKAVREYADHFESVVKGDLEIDYNIKFRDYARKVLDTKRQLEFITAKTYDRYLQLLDRVNREFGDVKVVDIRKQHLDKLRKNLLTGGNGYFESCSIATAEAVAASRKMTQAALAHAAGVDEKTVRRFQRGERIWKDKAEGISSALGMPFEAAFTCCPEAYKPLAPKTVREHINLVSSILKVAMQDDELIESNPAKTALKPSATPTKKEDCLTLDELILIREAAKSELLRWHCIINLLTECGDRRGAIIGIKIENLNLDENEIYMSPTIVSVHGHAMEKECQKSKNGDRSVTIQAETAELIRRWLVERNAEAEVKGDLWNDSGYLFPNQFGGPMHPDTLNHWLTKFSDRHGFRHLHPHMFRHAYTTLLVSKGLPVNIVAEAVGDKPETIIRHYVHKINSGSMIASNLLEKIYNDPDNA